VGFVQYASSKVPRHRIPIRITGDHLIDIHKVLIKEGVGVQIQIFGTKGLKVNPSIPKEAERKENRSELK
jgi:hypothetical protein